MESREAMNSGVTVIAPEAPSNYHMASRTGIYSGAGRNNDDDYTSYSYWHIPISSEKKKRVLGSIMGQSHHFHHAHFSVGTTNLRQLLIGESECRPSGVGEKASQQSGNFLPHMITVEAGEQGPRAICIISAVGLISNVTLRQPNSSGGTYENRRNEHFLRPDGRERLEVVVGSFLPSNYQEAKPKKQKAEPKAIAYATVSPAAPHSSNMEPRSSNAHNVNVPGAGTQNVISSSINRITGPLCHLS
ncbi:hypothetical protein HAX54_050878 [Datura stramonium]|uniref:AT-hook motif nuclear-localized protein n=1 Tax=Datura stramonium TaxID=4076 RepID=A0ABS8SZ34_DATST|nr:hypothetical protein [Datura stramonium]